MHERNTPQPRQILKSIHNGREAALETLLGFRHSPLGARELLDQLLRDHGIAGQDAAQARELALGVLRHQRLLDEQVRPLLKAPLHAMDRVARATLRLACYQHYLMDRVPEHALVDESVKLIRRASKPKTAEKQARFINGVLRNLLRGAPELNLDLPAAVRHSHPDWLARLIEQRYGAEAEAAMEWNNRRPDLHLRVNTLRARSEDVAAALRREGAELIEPPHPAPDCLIVSSTHGALHERKWFMDGLAAPQDMASQLVPHLLAPRPGNKVVDWCAAPGGKTCQLVALMQNQGRIFALDVDEARLRKVEEGAARLGAACIETHALNPALIDFLRSQPADCVLVDAPCTGLGTLRRNPDIRWRRKPEDAAATRKLQLEILDAAADCVRPGGALVYSVCTITEEETDSAANAFLAKYSQFREAGRSAAPEWLQTYLDQRGRLRTAPHRDQCDGFFAVKFIRHS
ncbi:16S rRNA (cytosine(967)-C(5))-methyltransferase RsmB [Candidatus Sumerlaeota bacterium]|nr:16S rRNA (cytosine(967)-C(5))-methyltransferase RsmB [Candidatus Sumerlaeota bacterium]